MQIVKFDREDVKLAVFQELVPGHIVMEPNSKTEFQVLSVIGNYLTLSSARQDNFPFFRKDKLARCIHYSVFETSCPNYLLVGHIKKDVFER